LFDIELGRWIAEGSWAALSTSDFNIKKLGPFLLHALLGGAVAGTLAAVVGGLSTLLWMRRRV
jgi:hypothetical protein